VATYLNIIMKISCDVTRVVKFEGETDCVMMTCHVITVVLFQGETGCVKMT